jgi:alcohol dehydrogenase class IV
MDKFTYVAMPMRVVFGAGRASELAAEVERLGAKRPLLISTPGRADMVRGVAKNLDVAGVFDQAVMHTPINVVETAREKAKAVGADCCITVGGGSTIGFGKAIALTSSLPVIAVPTTYSGSEMTTIWGISEAGGKKVGRDPKVLPKVVIYDPELTLDLPPATAAASGMNAIAHCAEALYAHDGNPLNNVVAEEGIRALAASLPRVVQKPRDITARSEALYGAWLAGLSISTTGNAIHHKLCHVLGGFGLPHAETHSIVLPHALRYNADAAPEAMRRIARALGAETAPAGMWDLEKRLGIPMKLAEIGMKSEDIERAAKIAVQTPYPNPRKVEYGPVVDLLRQAWNGTRP